MLELDDLSTEFRPRHDVYARSAASSFDLEPGECLGLVGESGSGKSVTALSMLGLVASPPGGSSAGIGALRRRGPPDGRDGCLRQVRGGRVAYIFQDPLSTLHPLITVGDQMVEAIRAHRPMPRRQRASTP